MKIEPESDVLKIQHVLGGVCYLFHVPNYPVFYLKKKTKKQKKNQKDTCTSIFSAALCTRAKTWKQPKCPQRNG